MSVMCDMWKAGPCPASVMAEMLKSYSVLGVKSSIRREVKAPLMLDIVWGTKKRKLKMKGHRWCSLLSEKRKRKKIKIKDTVDVGYCLRNAKEENRKRGMVGCICAWQQVLSNNRVVSLYPYCPFIYVAAYFLSRFDVTFQGSRSFCNCPKLSLKVFSLLPYSIL